MEVLRASSAGFCMGVGLALKKLEKALKDNMDAGSRHKRICTLGPIIHNPQVLHDFAARGVICLDDAKNAQNNDHVLIRAHGIPREEEKDLACRCARVEDATCPKVKKAQTAIKEATKNGAKLLLFGESSHPEVRGLVSYAHNGFLVFGSFAELADMPLDRKDAWVLASQTTQDREIFEKITKILNDRLPHLEVLSTICDATRERQEEALRLASEVDVMVVVGGRDSGNTRRLANLSAQAGITTFHVETANELRREDFIGKGRAGLTAGASTPKNLIDEAEKWLLTI